MGRVTSRGPVTIKKVLSVYNSTRCPLQLAEYCYNWPGSSGIVSYRTRLVMRVAFIKSRRRFVVFEIVADIVLKTAICFQA